MEAVKVTLHPPHFQKDTFELRKDDRGGGGGAEQKKGKWRREGKREKESV